MDDLRVYLLQCDISWNNPEKNHEKFENIIKTLKEPDVILFPETFTSGFCVEDPTASAKMADETRSWMKEMSETYKTALAGSILVQEEDKFYNRMFFYKPDGTFAYYDKRHLFSMGNESEKLSPGNKRVVVEWKGWKFFLQVCYDLRFPVFSNNDLGFDIMLYCANWPAERIEHWTTLIKARAVENQSYVLGCNRVGMGDNKIIYNGNSIIVGPFGKVLASAHEKEFVLTYVLLASHHKDTRAKYPFLQDVDKFELPEITVS